jgi:hypothetical protein
MVLASGIHTGGVGGGGGGGGSSHRVQVFDSRGTLHAGALGGALVMPRKPWSGPVLPPPKFPGVDMESCLAPGQL